MLRPLHKSASADSGSAAYLIAGSNRPPTSDGASVGTANRLTGELGDR
jgi:hypothetical protein